MNSKRVEFKTVDGVSLRGDLFLAGGTSIVIMTQGLTLLKEHYLRNWASRFVAAGHSVLIYDHRGWGSSDGVPRNATNPIQQAEDYHDAVLYVRSLPEVDGSKIAIWGIGHSAGASMIAAGDDPYIKAVILVMPFFSGAWDASNFPLGMLERMKAERARLVANPGSDHTYVQVWNNTAEEALGERDQALLHGPVAFKFIDGAKKLSDAAGTPWENKITLKSLYDIMKVEPQDHIHKIAPRKLLYLAATEDPISGPLDKQRAVFERAKEPKTFAQLDSDHVANYNAEFEKNVQIQLDFLHEAL